MKIIKTGPDLLIELVNEKERVPIAAAAKKLEVDAEQVTAWAEILSRKNIVGIYYPLTGDGILTKGGKDLIGKEIKEGEEKETKTSDDLVLLMADHNFLKFDRAVKKLAVERESVKKWVGELEKEDVIETEIFFFGDTVILRSDNFSDKLVEIKEKRKKESETKS